MTVNIKMSPKRPQRDSAITLSMHSLAIVHEVNPSHCITFSIFDISIYTFDLENLVENLVALWLKYPAMFSSSRS